MPVKNIYIKQSKSIGLTTLKRYNRTLNSMALFCAAKKSKSSTVEDALLKHLS